MKGQKKNQIRVLHYSHPQYHIPGIGEEPHIEWYCRCEYSSGVHGSVVKKTMDGRRDYHINIVCGWRKEICVWLALVSLMHLGPLYSISLYSIQTMTTEAYMESSLINIMREIEGYCCWSSSILHESSGTSMYQEKSVRGQNIRSTYLFQVSNGSHCISPIVGFF